MRIVDDKTGDEWDNEQKEYPIIEINGKKYRDVTSDAMDSSGCARGNKFGSMVGKPIENNTQFRIGKHWKKSKRIMSRRII